MLGLDQVEGTNLRRHTVPVMEIGPDWNYFEGAKKKLNYFFKDATLKFTNFNEEGSCSGELHLNFFPSLHVRLRDGEDGQPKMKERIVAYAKENLDPSIDFWVYDVLEDWYDESS